MIVQSGVAAPDAKISHLRADRIFRVCAPLVGVYPRTYGETPCRIFRVCAPLVGVYPRTYGETPCRIFRVCAPLVGVV